MLNSNIGRGGLIRGTRGVHYSTEQSPFSVSADNERDWVSIRTPFDQALELHTCFKRIFLNTFFILL